MTEERPDTEREAAQRAGRGTMSHIDEHAIEHAEDSRNPPSEDPRGLREDGEAKGG